MSGQEEVLAFSARGASMAPMLPDGTPVMIRTRPAQLPRVGEIVLVPWGDTVALHRVVRVRNQQIVTRGDGCPADDPPVPVSGIQGVAIHALRKGRSLPLDGPGMRALGWMLAKVMPALWRIRMGIRPY